MTFGLLALSLLATQGNTGPLVLQDRYGNDLKDVGLTLVDWEGPIANPAVLFRLKVNKSAYLPMKVDLSANGSRLMFNLFSTVSSSGPQKTLFINQENDTSEFYMSIAHDDDITNETYTLHIETTDANQAKRSYTFPIAVIDQDIVRNDEFVPTLDFSYDKTGLFHNPEAKAIAQKAVQDWCYYLDKQHFDEVAADTEESWVWNPDGFKAGFPVRNKEKFRDFLLYFHGISHEPSHSGAGASERGAWHSRSGITVGLRRSGTVSMETSGNWNRLGWLFDSKDTAWNTSSNMSWEKHDFYSVVKHEIGHALAFHKVHSAFNHKIIGNRFVDDTIRSYVGKDPLVSEVEHFYETIDPVSKVGVFGNEYGGNMPRYRWFITKFDLLIFQAVGYRLRDTSPFRQLQVKAPSILRFNQKRKAYYHFRVKDGIPPYCFRVVSGSLPTNMTLNIFTGELVGRPNVRGEFPIQIKVLDQNPTAAGVDIKTKISVR
jgi:hypothetical protein